MSAGAQPMYGVVTIDGHQYIERWQIIPFQLAVTVALAPINFRIPLPGVYDFRLKGLTRDTLVTAQGVTTSTARRFTTRLGNTDGDIRYSQGGVGSTSDQVLDTLLFGNAQFPYPIIPPIFYGKNAAIIVDFTDLSGNVPYQVQFAFHGAYLIPV